MPEDQPPGSLEEASLPGPIREKAAETAAAAAVEPERLLPGEDVATPYRDDAEHWLAVYGELLDAKRHMIAQVKQEAPDMTAAARREVEETDLVVMQVEAERFARRLAFWRRRLDELSRGEGC